LGRQGLAPGFGVGGPQRAGYNGPRRHTIAAARSSLNLPNALTVSRIFLVPLLVVVLLTKFEGRQVLGVRKELVAAAIFGIAALTDWLDGFLARRRKQVTPLGQMMDPLADKLLTSGAFISLVAMEVAPAWMVAVIIGREFAVTGLRSIAYGRGQALPASPLGKFKMISQVVAILLLILGKDHLQGYFVLGRVALWVVMVTAVISAVDYYRRFNWTAGPRGSSVLLGDRRREGSGS
jgi:CDP-diacylglycerol--glycerol-3-phosphate 3-phosphatidyltransferase